jgi:O-antigen/teichoic acid export membrane protein
MAFRVLTLSPVAWVTAEKITQQALWLILFTILAPILGPRPYGVFSIVMVFVGFCEFVLGEVAVEALVTVDELGQDHMATANLVTGVLALVVSLILGVLAPVIAFAFEDDEIKWLIWSLVPLPMLSLVSAVPIAMLRRALRYKPLAIRSIVGLLIGGLFGIGLALAGAGVWALALQVLAQRTAEVVIAWLSISQRFRLGWSALHFREMRSVGMNMFAARAMMFASGQLPRLVLGYVLGPSELGLFTLATRFLDIAVNTALFPRIIVGRIEMRDCAPDSAEFRRRFIRMAQDAGFLSCPILLGATVIMPDLFRVWLDQRWLPGIAAAQLTMVSGLPMVYASCLDAALLASKLSSVFRTTSTIQAVTVLLVALCAAPFGLTMTCAALAIRPWLLLPFFLWIFLRRSELRISDVLKPPLPPLLGSILMGGVLSLPFLHPAWLDQKLTMAGLIIAGAIIYGGFLYSFSRAQLMAALSGLFAHRG